MLRKIIKPKLATKEVLISLPETYVGKELEIIVFTKDEGLENVYFDDFPLEIMPLEDPRHIYSTINSAENTKLKETDELKYWLHRAQELIKAMEEQPKKQVSFTVLNTQGQSFTFNREEANER
jgi:hypothetical protein